MSVTTTQPLARSEELFGHPKGLYVCFFTEMWERFSFYGMKALLALYLVKHHGFNDTETLALIGAYGGLVYATPVLGGMLADRYLGMRKAVVLGAILLCLGHVGMAFEGHQATMGTDGVMHRDLFALSIFYLSLALIISGVGFLKPNISTVVGKLYPDNDPRRDSGFTLFYAGINVGALFSALICGFLGDAYGWSYGFGAAGIGMLAGLAVFLTGQKHLLGYAEPPDLARLRRRIGGIISVEWTIYLGAVLALPGLWALMQLGRAVLYVQLGIMAAWLAWLAWYVTVRCNPVQRRQMLACVFFVAVCLLFFSLYEQTYGSWILFNDRMLTKDLFPSLVIRDGHPFPWSTIPLILSPFVVGASLWLRSTAISRWLMGSLAMAGTLTILRDCIVLPQSASSLTYLGAFFIVLLSPIAAWLWPVLERRNLNPSKPMKSVIGLALAGIAFLPLVAANGAVSASALGSVWWIVLAYLLLEMGEVVLSPIGLAAVCELSVPSVVGVMMGAWWLGTSLSEQVAALLGQLAALDIPSDGKIDFSVAAARYGHLFEQMTWLGLASAALALIAVPFIKRWMRAPN